MAKINSTIFKQETIQSWFADINTSINNEVIQPFQNARKVIDEYNLAIQHNSLTQEEWERLLSQSDDSMKAYLTNIKGSTASITGYNVSLQGNITGFRKVSSAISQYNTLSTVGTEEQDTFATAVSTTNSRLGAYLTGLNGANASLGGYIIHLVGATAKTVALKAATIALNAALTMGVSLIVSSVATAISSWIHKTENMINASEDAVEKIKTINNELKNNQKTISDTAKRYAELAQGVDQLTGKNISLSNEDYEEFLNLSNQIAEIFPELPRIYKENGDAIVQLSGDVDTIVGSLHNLIDAQRDLTNRQIVDELPTVFGGVAAKSDAYQVQLEDFEDKKNALLQGLESFTSEGLSQKFQTGLNDKYLEIVSNDVEEYSRLIEDYTKLLDDTNLEYNLNNLEPIWNGEYDSDGKQVLTYKTSIYIESSDEDIENAKTSIDAQINELAKKYEKDIEKLNEKIKITNEKNKANWNSLSNSIFAWLSTDNTFMVMDDTMQATVQNIVNSLDWGKLNFSSWEVAKQYIQDNILSLFSTTEGKDILADIQVMFGIQTQFNDGDITVEQYQAKLQEFLASIESLPPESKKSIMLLFGIETNEDGTTTSDIDTMIANVQGKLSDEFDDKVGELSLGDLQIASEKLELDPSVPISWDELLIRIEEYKENQKSLEPVSFSDIFSLEDAEGEATPLGNLNDQVDELQKAYTGLKEIMDSYNESGTFTLDQVQEIISYGGEYLKYLMDENGNLQLNEEALNNVAIARINEMRAKVLSNLMDNLDNITNEESALEYLRQQLINTAEGYDELTESRINAWIYNTLDSNITDSTRESLLANFRNQANAINEMFDNISIGSISAGDTSSAETDYSDLLKKETTLLEKQLEAGIITFKDYTDKRKSIIEDYYRQGLISAEDYYSALEDMYDYQLSLYDKVIDAVNYRIDKEIDALEKEKESIEDTYNLRIKSIQTEIDELEKAREKREQQVALEKALYEVEKARSQKNVKLYSGSDRGVIYTNDSKALREAEENLENEKYESHISKLEEQIESLEEEMEKTTDAIDEQIESLREYADDWSDVANAYEHAQNDMIATQILGANYEEEILNKRRATLEIFKNDYIAAQNAMAEANRKVYESQISETKPSGFKDDVVDKGNPKETTELVGEGWATQSEATSKIANYNGNGVKKGNNGLWYVYKTKKYHTGLDEGYVGDKTTLSKDKRLDILQKAGNGVLLKPDEQLSILKNKELVLTEYQGINIADALWQKAMIPNMTLPNYNFDNIALRNNTPSQIVNIGDIHLHEVQNVPDFAKALQKHLPNISVQYNGKH